MKHYYLIKDTVRDGDHEYHDTVLVEAETLYDSWGDDWDLNYCHWNFCINEIDKDEWWSGMRIVSVEEPHKVSNEDAEVFKKHMYTHSFEDIMEEGRKDLPTS